MFHIPRSQVGLVEKTFNLIECIKNMYLIILGYSRILGLIQLLNLLILKIL